MVTKRFGFFKDPFQRSVGTPEVTTSYSITPNAVNANVMSFNITSTVTSEPTIAYRFNNLSSSMIAESTTGNVTLDSAGNATVNITLVPTANVGVNTEFSLSLLDVNDVEQVVSANANIATVGTITTTGGTKSTVSGNTVHIFNHAGTPGYSDNSQSLVISDLAINDWEPPEFRVILVGGGGPGSHAMPSGDTYLAYGGGAGGGVLDQVDSFANLTNTSYSLSIGGGGRRSVSPPQFGGASTALGYEVKGGNGAQQRDETPGFDVNTGGGYVSGLPAVVYTTATGSSNTGGDGSSLSTTHLTGGGGAGAGGNGGNASGSTGGNGGAGTTVPYLGTVSGGGGGASIRIDTGIGGTVGSGTDGGGDGGSKDAGAGQDGTGIGSGGGGGGRGYWSSAVQTVLGGAGAPGAIAFAYSDTPFSVQYRIFKPTS